MRKLKSLLTAALILALFCTGITLIDRWLFFEGRRALVHELEQAAAHCYAAEGRYPPTSVTRAALWYPHRKPALCSRIPPDIPGPCT